MAKRGIPLFATECPRTFVQEHEKLIALHRAGMSVYELCARYDASYPTVSKWLSTPVGTLPKWLQNRLALGSPNPAQEFKGAASPEGTSEHPHVTTGATGCATPAGAR